MSDRNSVDAILDEATTAAGAPSPSGSGRAGWWRRNRLALVAFVVLAAVTVAVVGGNAWLGYYEGRASIPERVAAQTARDYAGTTWTLESLDRFESSDPIIREGLAPVGTVVISAAVQIDPSDPATYCTFELVEQRAGVEDRVWRAEIGSVWAEFDERRENGCAPEATGSYLAEPAFVIPADADGELLLRVTVSEGLPRYLLMAGD